MLIEIRPIKTEADYEWALKEIEQYFDKEPKKGSAESIRFDVLAMLIEAYEDEHYPIEGPKDPVDYLRAVMDATGRTQSDLSKLLGSRSRASEIMTYKRSLSIGYIRKLSDEWGLSVETLVMPYALARDRSKAKSKSAAKKAARRRAAA